MRRTGRRKAVPRTIDKGDHVLFEVWAPEKVQVTLQLAGRGLVMERDPSRDGWWIVDADAADGDLYGYALDGGPVRPDPRSRRQPTGPDGLSAVDSPDTYHWRTQWPGRGTARCGVLRAAHRYVHPRGHLRRGRPDGWTISPVSA